MATVNYEVVYKLDGIESWLYFHSEEGKAKAAGEKHYKRVMRDSGWTKRAKLIRIRKLVKAVDPPLTKAQKNALRSRSGTKKVITHDGHVQIGSLKLSLKRFLELCQVPVSVVYWMPDPLGLRYPRLNYQRTNEIAGKAALELTNSEWTRRGNL